jgi:serine protease
VAGVAALYLETDPNASAETVFAAVYDATTKNIVTSSSTENNHLLYSLAWGEGSEPPPAENEPPSASFTYSCMELDCSFTDTSADSDGDIVSWAWAFGDGATSTAQNPSHTYGAGGSYTVTLTVTDNDGATDSASQAVTVSGGDEVGADISLSVDAYKVRGRKHADLSWSGATSTTVYIYRDGSEIDTVTDFDAYTHSTNEVGGGSHVYQVCEADPSTCSNEVVVTY